MNELEEKQLNLYREALKKPEIAREFTPEEVKIMEDYFDKCSRAVKAQLGLSEPETEKENENNS